MKYQYVPPKIIQILFPYFRWQTSNKKILLTFDDGPNPPGTEKILEILSGENIKAIFFCVGNNISKYPELVNRILEQGHSIGNHTYNHSTITKIPLIELRKELEMVNLIMKDKYSYSVKYFRPPHGKFFLRTNSFLAHSGLENIMWSLLIYDYQNNLNIVKFAVQNYLRSNSIIVLHDSMKSKDIICDSLRFIIDEVESKGYEFGEPSECLK